jgi:hypothetical protein
VIFEVSIELLTVIRFLGRVYVDVINDLEAVIKSSGADRGSLRSFESEKKNVFRQPKPKLIVALQMSAANRS